MNSFGKKAFIIPNMNKIYSYIKDIRIGWLFNLQSIIYWLSIGFMASYWVIYFQDVGYTFSEISIILMMLPLASLISEIPTGIIADKYGRKISVCLSYLLTGFSFITVILCSNNFVLVTIAYFFAGVSITLESGALDAWIFEEFKNINEEKINKLMSIRDNLGQLGFILGSFLGGFFVGFLPIKLNFIIAAFLLIALSILVFVFGHEHYKKNNASKNITKVSFFEIVKSIKNDKTLVLFIIASFFMAIGGSIYFNTYSAYLNELSYNESLLGYALTVSGILSFFFLNYADNLKHFVKGNINVIILGIILTILVITLLLWLSISWYTFFLLVLFTFISEFYREYSPSYQ